MKVIQFSSMIALATSLMFCAFSQTPRKEEQHRSETKQKVFHIEFKNLSRPEKDLLKLLCTHGGS